MSIGTLPSVRRRKTFLTVKVASSFYGVTLDAFDQGGLFYPDLAQAADLVAMFPLDVVEGPVQATGSSTGDLFSIPRPTRWSSSFSGSDEHSPENLSRMRKHGDRLRRDFPLER
ncbi:MAG: hypothetical protein JWM36_2265 [Hyphomicrobiales bacterium]|nr:hypothetical protein [Hyphomicrobiales bacterium]